MAHTLYCDKNFAKFNFTKHASYPPGNSGWTDQGTAHGTWRRAKIFVENIFSNEAHRWNWQKFSPGENFHEYGIIVIMLDPMFACNVTVSRSKSSWEKCVKVLNVQRTCWPCYIVHPSNLLFCLGNTTWVWLHATVCSVAYRNMIFEMARWVGDMMLLGCGSNASIVMAEVSKAWGGKLELKGWEIPGSPTTLQFIIIIKAVLICLI